MRTLISRDRFPSAQVCKAHVRAAKRTRVDFAHWCPWDPRHGDIGMVIKKYPDGRDTLTCKSEQHVSARGTHYFEFGVHEWELVSTWLRVSVPEQA